MSLALKVLGGCDVGAIQNLEFYAGEDVTLKMQVIDLSKFNAPHVIPVGAVNTLYLNGTPDDIVIPNADITVNSDDRSIFSVNLTDAQTALLMTGDIRLSYESGTTTRMAVKTGGLKKLIRVV